MMKPLLKRHKVLSLLALMVFTSGSIIPSKAFSAVADSEAVTLQPTAIAETREILERASQIALQGVSAIQQLQTLSTDTTTSEVLKNYMASMVYIPHATNLPTDIEALDEPWANENNPDGLVVPHMDDDGGVSHGKGVDIDVHAVKKALKFKLLQPVQNALVSSNFGLRWGRAHQGIDMAAPMGTSIMSAEAGKVIYSGWQTGYGNFISVDHGHGYQTNYAHCSQIVVHVGQAVKKGQLIGKVGNTGNSTGPHLHFEVLANGVHRNPVKFLNQSVTVVSAH